MLIILTSWYALRRINATGEKINKFLYELNKLEESARKYVDNFFEENKNILINWSDYIEKITYITPEIYDNLFNKAISLVIHEFNLIVKEEDKIIYDILNKKYKLRSTLINKLLKNNRTNNLIICLTNILNYIKDNFNDINNSKIDYNDFSYQYKHLKNYDFSDKITFIKLFIRLSDFVDFCSIKNKSETIINNDNVPNYIFEKINDFQNQLNNNELSVNFIHTYYENFFHLKFTHFEDIIYMTPPIYKHLFDKNIVSIINTFYLSIIEDDEKIIKKYTTSNKINKQSSSELNKLFYTNRIENIIIIIKQLLNYIKINFFTIKNSPKKYFYHKYINNKLNNKKYYLEKNITLEINLINFVNY